MEEAGKRSSEIDGGGGRRDSVSFDLDFNCRFLSQGASGLGR